MIVIKRDGTEVHFEKGKIFNAISKANANVLEKKMTNADITKISNRLYERCLKRKHSVSVEDIQDMVENELMKENYYNVAREYITYRYRHQMARNNYDKLMKDITTKISADNVQNQNANVDEHSFGGRVGETSDLIMKQYALDYCMSEMSKRNHLNNEIYVHDLNSYAVGSHNCLSVPFDDLLANGFNTRQTDVRPAQSVSTAFQLIAVIFQLQSLQQFGRLSAC